MDPVIRDIEDAFFAHWTRFGEWDRGTLHDEDGVLWFETPIAHMPYNGVIRTRIEGDPGPRIAAIVGRFASRGMPFYWLVHPSAAPADLSRYLEDEGLDLVEVATGMSLDLTDWQPIPLPEGVEYREVLGKEDSRVYEELILKYWDLPEDSRALIRDLGAFAGYGPGSPCRRWLASLEGLPVGKAYLSLRGPGTVASIYGVSVLPEARGRGVASGLTTVLVQQAIDLGFRRMVLHATEMAVSLYRRAGFTPYCSLDVYATAPLFTTHHH